MKNDLPQPLPASYPASFIFSHTSASGKACDLPEPLHLISASRTRGEDCVGVFSKESSHCAAF
jgi:hypothetical protein